MYIHGSIKAHYYSDLYKKYETRFTSTMIKAEAVWKKIAAEMKTADYEFSSG